jgi:hypothetical protein
MDIPMSRHFLVLLNSLRCGGVGSKADSALLTQTSILTCHAPICPAGVPQFLQTERLIYRQHYRHSR